jgi:hypothetical protein
MTVPTLERIVRPAVPKHLSEQNPSGVNSTPSSPDVSMLHFVRRAIVDARRTPADLRDAKPPQQESGFRGLKRRFEHMRAGLSLREAWDIAKRGMNGQEEVIRFDADTNPDSYSGVTDRAVEDPRLTDHNRHHERRVRLHTEALLLNIGEVRHIPHISDYLPAAASFAPRHDRVQLLRQAENLDKPQAEHLPPKFTHATGGAILDLLEVNEYAHAAGLTLGEARGVKAASAYMIMKHDEPADLGNALLGRTDATQLPQGFDLLTAYNNNQLDLTTLSPAQLLQIHIEEASRKPGFVTAETPHGLPRVIEEQYADRLAAMALDTMPLLPSITPDQRQALNVLTEIVVVADMMDMIIPPEESLARKLLVPRSRTRPFFRPEIAQEQLVENAFASTGNLPQEIESDVGRALWEYAHALDMFPAGVVTQSSYAKRVIGKAIIQGGMALEELGTYLMQGEDLDAESSPLSRIYDRRIKNLGDKALRKVETPKRRRAELQHNNPLDMDATHYAETVVYQFGASGGIAARFENKVGDIRSEKDELVRVLIPKQRDTDNQPFSPEAITQFQQSVRTVLDRLSRRHGITPAEIDAYREELLEGKYTTPYSAYDSFALPWDRRPILPTQEWVNIAA